MIEAKAACFKGCFTPRNITRAKKSCMPLSKAEVLTQVGKMFHVGKSVNDECCRANGGRGEKHVGMLHLSCALYI